MSACIEGEFYPLTLEELNQTIQKEFDGTTVEYNGVCHFLTHPNDDHIVWKVPTTIFIKYVHHASLGEWRYYVSEILKRNPGERYYKHE